MAASPTACRRPPRSAPVPPFSERHVTVPVTLTNREQPQGLRRRGHYANSSRACGHCRARPLSRLGLNRMNLRHFKYGHSLLGDEAANVALRHAEVLSELLNGEKVGKWLGLSTSVPPACTNGSRNSGTRDCPNRRIFLLASIIALLSPTGAGSCHLQPARDMYCHKYFFSVVDHSSPAARAIRAVRDAHRSIAGPAPTPLGPHTHASCIPLSRFLLSPLCVSSTSRSMLQPSSFAEPPRQSVDPVSQYSLYR